MYSLGILRFSGYLMVYTWSCRSLITLVLFALTLFISTFLLLFWCSAWFLVWLCADKLFLLFIFLCYIYRFDYFIVQIITTLILLIGLVWQLYPVIILGILFKLTIYALVIRSCVRDVTVLLTVVCNKIVWLIVLSSIVTDSILWAILLYITVSVVWLLFHCSSLLDLLILSLLLHGLLLLLGLTDSYLLTVFYIVVYLLHLLVILDYIVFGTTDSVLALFLSVTGGLPPWAVFLVTWLFLFYTFTSFFTISWFIVTFVVVMILHVNHFIVCRVRISPTPRGRALVSYLLGTVIAVSSVIVVLTVV